MSKQTDRRREIYAHKTDRRYHGPDERGMCSMERTQIQEVIPRPYLCEASVSSEVFARWIATVVVDQADCPGQSGVIERVQSCESG